MMTVAALVLIIVFISDLYKKIHRWDDEHEKHFKTNKK